MPAAPDTCVKGAATMTIALGRTGGDGAATRQLFVECLGRFRLSDCSQSQAFGDWARHCHDRAGVYKVQSVLAYLIHAGRRGATRSALNQAIWSRKANAATISRTLGALSDVLADLCGDAFIERHLLITADHLILNPECYQTDAQRFLGVYDRAAQLESDRGLAAAAPLYEQALRQYGGPYMVDIPRADYWCGERREQLASSFVNVCERLAEHTFAERRYRSCITLCQQALDVEETADDIVCWLMRAFHALDMRAELEHGYRLYQRAVSASGDHADADVVAQTYRSLHRERAVGGR